MRNQRVVAAVLASTLLGLPVAARALVYSAEHRPIPSTTNEAVVLIEGGVPRTTTLQNCDADPSFLEIEYDSILSEVTITDGVLCGTDLVLTPNVSVENITIRLGATAQAVNPYPQPIVPFQGTVGPDDIAVFESDVGEGEEEFTLLFSATLSFGELTSEVVIPVGGSFSGPLAVDGVTGRLTFRELTGISQGILDPDGAGTVFEPRVVTAELTLNLESLTFPPEFGVFGDGFESGDLFEWSESVGAR